MREHRSAISRASPVGASGQSAIRIGRNSAGAPPVAWYDPDMQVRHVVPPYVNIDVIDIACLLQRPRQAGRDETDPLGFRVGQFCHSWNVTLRLDK